jgi:hypothetical protein
MCQAFRFVLMIIFSVFFCSFNAVQTIQGTVFEDANYGGGSGRSFGLPGTASLANATVELYDNAGNYIQATTTNAAGVYTFSVNSNTSYLVRVANKSVASARTGWVNTLMAVQTFRTDASIAGIVSSITDRVGGEMPSENDAPVNATNASMGSLNSVSGQEVQSLTAVNVAGSNVTGVDFGFCYDVVVNTNDAGQGSLRQFILNSNALGGEANLAQAGFTWNSLDSVNAAIPLPAMKETSIFMIADGNAHPGLRAGLANLLSADGVAIITPLVTQFNITGANALNTNLDGGTQTANVGNNNNIMLGTGGTVGIGSDGVPGTGDEMKLCKINGSEIELITNSLPAGTNGLSIFADSVTARNLCIHSSKTNDIGIVAVYGTVIEQNVLGSSAISFTPPSVFTQGDIIRISNSSRTGMIKNNLIGFTAFSKIIGAFRTTLNVNWAIINNECAGNNTGSAGIAFNSFGAASGTSGYILLRGNLCRNNGPTGISADLDYRSNPTGLMAKVIEENTCRDNNSSGIQAIQGDGNDTIRYNLVYNNGTMGIRVSKRDGASINRVKISQNSTYNNGGLGIDLDENGVTSNDGILDATAILANNNIDYPIFVAVSFKPDTLTVSGFVGSAPLQTQFANARVEIFKGKGNGNENGEIIVGDGLSVPHIEGQRYLGALIADANGMFSGKLTQTGLSVGDSIVATATDASGNTSEFGAFMYVLTNVLPVYFSNFTAIKKDNGTVVLNWQSSDAINVKYFIVERGGKENFYKSVGIIPAGINQQFTFTDPSPANGVNHYKIKIEDINGKYISSGIKSLTINKKLNPVIALYPNPAPSLTNIVLSKEFKKVNIVARNISGQPVFHKIYFNTGWLKFPVEQLAKGKYFIDINTDGEQSVMELLITH